MKLELPSAFAGPAVVAPLHAGSVLPANVIDQVTGLAPFARADIAFVRPGDDWPKRFPFLRLRASESADADSPGTWWIEDRPTAIERVVFGKSDRVRISTGCREHDKNEAAIVFETYVGYKRNAILGQVLPTQIQVDVVLDHFTAHVDSGGDNLAANTIAFYRGSLPPLRAFFAGMRLGQLTKATCKAYEKWRLAQTVQCNKNRPVEERRKISRKTVHGDLSTLRTALNLWKSVAQVNLEIKLWLPKVLRPRVRWLNRNDVARMFWALRGRAWNTEAGRWRVRRDDDPSLAGPEGDVRVVVPPADADEAARRTALARFVFAGLYSASRHQAVLRTTYRDESRAHFSFVQNGLHRRGLSEPETRKGRPAVLLVPKLYRKAINCARLDAAKGVTTFVHKADGTPYSHIRTDHWRAIQAAAGLDKPLCAHLLRHSCAMWLKNEGVPLQIAAEFLGCTTRTLEARYGRWDLEFHRSAALALSRGARQKEALAEMRKAGFC